MNTERATIWILVATALGLVGWDIFVASNRVRGDTISEVLLESAKRHPIIAAGWGLLTGHLFWSQSQKQRDESSC